MNAIGSTTARLQEIFGNRVKMICAFGEHAQTCAFVDRLTLSDLEKCAAAFGSTRPAPLVMPVDELSRALDAFPLELNEIISSRRLLAGSDLLAPLAVSPEDLRRACEAQARSHLVHLREGYIEAGGNRKAVARLVAASAAPFRALVTNVARLAELSPDTLRAEIGAGGSDFPSALTAAERLVEYVDRWRA